ncbi:MFS general substrate transporter [Ramaria rubella]|nr:MFS general substrate transporter [Ramaria rubella]
MLSSSTPDESSSQLEKTDKDDHNVRVEEKESVSVHDDDDFDEELVKKTIRKVDIRLLPILGAIYSFSLIDRNNLSNARISGADTEIGLGVGNHYSLATLVFFIPYIILEIPSNMVFRRVGASPYLATIGFLWGVVILSMGFVKTWNQMAALRGILGILEAGAGFFPACVWLISCWYKRAEVQVRMASFYLMSVVAGSFSSIIAYGLSTIRAGHLSGWRWILIVEGIITCGLSIIGYFIIVDFPDKNTFLTKEETALVKSRVERDRADTNHDPLTFAKCIDYACDLKLWGFALAYLCTTTATYAYGYFTPIILVGLGFSVKKAQLLIAPTGIAACIFALGLSKISDRYQTRGLIVVVQALMAITGLAMTGYSPNNSVRFAGAFIGVSGAQGNIPALLAYQSNNIRRQSKRAFSSALQVAFGGIGGIVTSVAYRQQDAPVYRLGMTITIVLQGVIILIVAMNSMWFAYCNRQVRQGRRVVESQPGFLYTL